MDFTGASLDGVILSRTNLKNAIGLAKPLIEEAIKEGAVSMGWQQYIQWKAAKFVSVAAQEYSRGQEDGFQVDESGRPLFSNQKHP